MLVMLQRSSFLLAYLFMVHVAAGLLLVWLDFHWLLRMGLILLIFFSFVCQLRRYGWLGQKLSLKAIQFNADKGWFTWTTNDVVTGPMALKRSVILGPLIVLYLQSAVKARSQQVVVTRDMFDQEQWRQLRIKLRDPEIWDQ